MNLLYNFPLNSFLTIVATDKDAPAFPLFTAAQAIAWMADIVRKSLPKDSVAIVSTSKRGAELINFGKRKYDIIPSYLVDNGIPEQIHFIPNGSKWELNPTDRDLSRVRKLRERFPRNQESKKVGFAEVVKLFKFFSRELNWPKDFGLSSFHLRCAVMDLFERAGQPLSRARIKDD